MNKREILVYISGKYTGYDENGDLDLDLIQKNIDFARDYSIKVWEAGFTALCPHLNTLHFEKDCNCKYDDYITGDLRMIDSCDYVFLIPGWEESRGAKIEREYAEKKNIPIVYTIEELLELENNKLEKYYICESCGDLTTNDEILEDCSNGGQGMCGCRFNYYFWNEEINEPDCQCDRVYIPYTEIKKEHYEWLISEENTAERLRMFLTIPKELLP